MGGLRFYNEEVLDSGNVDVFIEDYYARIFAWLLHLDENPNEELSLSTATLRRSGQIHRIHIHHAITGTATTINPKSENVNETLSASSTTIPLDVSGFRKSSVHKVSAESLKARPVTTSSKKTTTMTATASTITTVAPSSTLASSVLPSFSKNRRLIIINRSFTPRNRNDNDSLNHLPSQSSANLKQTSIITTDIPENDSKPTKLFFATTHRQVNVTPKFADTSTSEIISKASTTLPIASTDLKFPIQSSLDTGDWEAPIEESMSEILPGRATSESFAKLLGKESGNLLGTFEVPNKVDKSIPMEMPIPLPEKEFTIKQIFGKGTKDNELRESFPGVLSTLTPPPSTLKTSLPSVQQIGAPGAAPPNDSVVDELNRAENFMESAYNGREILAASPYSSRPTLPNRGPLQGQGNQARLLYCV
ncbi:unnamed protein product [Angiostrongylus costaricensis]|uniref:Flocculation protein FLO11-like n=1 Tax=Angiostrongylus costaricensis TaxID=334426 RepID=A0A158PIM6_ANGCS|nr:unnamed protein product [Angiostrongylus costaricensis]